MSRGLGDVYKRQALLYSFSAKDTAIAYHNIGYIYGMRDMQDSAITYQRKSVGICYAF